MTGSLTPSALPARSATTNTPGIVAAPEILPVGKCSVSPGGSGEATELGVAGGERAVGTRHEHHVVLARDARHHLLDARVLGPGQPFDALQQGDLLRAVERSDRVHRRVQHAAAGDLRRTGQLHAPLLARGGDGAHRAGRVHQGLDAEVVGIGEGRLLAGHGAQADPAPPAIATEALLSSRRYIAEFMRICAPGGAVYFQLTAGLARMTIKVRDNASSTVVIMGYPILSTTSMK